MILIPLTLTGLALYLLHDTWGRMVQMRKLTDSDHWEDYGHLGIIIGFVVMLWM